MRPEPSASTSSIRPSSVGMSGLAEAGWTSSARMPTTTSRPSACVTPEYRVDADRCDGQGRRADRDRHPTAVRMHRPLEQVHRRRSDEARDEEVERLVVEVLWGVDLLEDSHAHHGDAIAHGHRLDLVVRHVDRGRRELVLELADLGSHLHPELRVEVRERLVHQEHLRLAHDRAAHGDALALPTGKLLRLPRQVRGQIEQLRRPGDPLGNDGLRHLAQPQPEPDVVRDGEVRVERVVLEHHRDVPVLRREVVHDAIADRHRPVGDVLEPRDHPQRRRLAAARRADEHEELAVLDVQREVLHGVHVALVDLVDFLQLNVSHRSSPPWSHDSPDVEGRPARGQDDLVAVDLGVLADERLRAARHRARRAEVVPAHGRRARRGRAPSRRGSRAGTRSRRPRRARSGCLRARARDFLAAAR